MLAVQSQLPEQVLDVEGSTEEALQGTVLRVHTMNTTNVVFDLVWQTIIEAPGDVILCRADCHPIGSAEEFII